MPESTTSHEELATRVARLEAQVAWLNARIGASADTDPGVMAPPVAAPPPPQPAPRILPIPAVPKAPREPANPIVWVAGAGAVLFLVGSAFFLRWAIEQGWLGPELRFLLGLLGDCVLTGLAARTMLRDSARLGVTLLLAGLGTLLFTFRWGALVYHFFPPAVGLGASFLGVLLAGGLSARVRSGAALAVGLGVGLAAPLVFSQGGHHEIALALYLLVLMGAALAVPYVARTGARWHGSRWFALAGTWLWLGIACVTVLREDAALLGLLLGAHFLLAGLWIWLPGQAEPKPSSPTTLWVTTSLATTSLAWALWLNLGWEREAFALVVLGFAALNLALVKPLRHRLGGRPADLGLLALAAGHLALAVPVALAWRWVGPVWGCFALALAWAVGYARTHEAWAEEADALARLALAMAAAATLRWAVHGLDTLGYGATSQVPFLNVRFAEGALAAGAWALILRGGGVDAVMGFLGLEIVGGLTLSLELAQLVRYLGGSYRAVRVAVTLAWALLGALQWLRSLGEEDRRRLALAGAGYAWLGLASFKLIFVDLGQADVPTRALAFLGVGGIFMTAALVGNASRRKGGR